jgi:hypothetical protein
VIFRDLYYNKSITDKVAAAYLKAEIKIFSNLVEGKKIGSGISFGQKTIHHWMKLTLYKVRYTLRKAIPP